MGKYKLVDRATEPGPVGLCGTAPLWTTCRTIYGGQTVWKVVITAVPMKVEIAGPMSAMRTKLPLFITDLQALEILQWPD